jgi:hypothetical protein
MKIALVVALSASAVLPATAASADDKAACINAAQQAQNLRDAHKLVEAREQLRVCARRQCPGVVQRDCLTWLGEVEKSLPTVVVTAKDEAGVDIADVKVTVDGDALLDKLDGSAVPMNPGMHAFHFAGSDGATQDRQVLVREGQTNQGVAVVLKKVSATPMAPPPSLVAPAVSPAPAPSAPVASGGSSAWKTVGWVLGGVGVVGLGVGTAFGVAATSNKKNANCGTDNLCDAGPLSSARSAAVGADVGFIAGGALLAAGVALVLIAPGAGHEGQASVRITPIVAAGGGAVVVGGGW